MKRTVYRYMEKRTGGEMHYHSLQWLSELEFFEDEHRFFEDMLREYTMPILESHLFTQIQAHITDINSSKTQLTALKTEIRKHNVRLLHTVETEDKEEEKKNRQEHMHLQHAFEEYSRQLRDLKKQIFASVSKALRQQKQKRLLT